MAKKIEICKEGGPFRAALTDYFDMGCYSMTRVIVAGIAVSVSVQLTPERDPEEVV